MSNRSWFHKIFFEDPPGRFAFGFILSSLKRADLDPYDGDDEVGFWQCDLRKHDKLAWSKKVYEIFGFPHGAPVAREEAVSRYTKQSREALERVRAYAVRRKCGFLLDAEISPQGEDHVWIRVLAAPVVEKDRIVGLRGLKRVL